MGAQTIVVTFAGGHLTIDPDPFTVEDGDWVVWRFEGVPDGCLPYVRFPSGFGPFQALRSYGGMQIVSKGHLPRAESADGNSHTYTAMILKAEEVHPRASQQGTIVNHATAEEPLPDVLVTFDHDKPEGEKVVVSPDTIRINEGDTVNWRVTGLRPGHFVTFQFLDGEGAPARLFKSFYLLPGERPGEARASAIGFLAGAGAAPSSFSYQIRVRSEAGDLLGGHDPAIDNIGPPIPVGDGGS